MQKLDNAGPYRTTTIRLHPQDTVASALQAIKAGDSIRVGDVGGSTVQEIILLEDIPIGHKFALIPIQKGREIRKHGVVIGRATADIPAGAWVSEHNLE